MKNILIVAALSVGTLVNSAIAQTTVKPTTTTTTTNTTKPLNTTTALNTPKPQNPKTPKPLISKILI